MLISVCVHDSICTETLKEPDRIEKQTE